MGQVIYVNFFTKQQLVTVVSAPPVAEPRKARSTIVMQRIGRSSATVEVDPKESIRLVGYDEVEWNEGKKEYGKDFDQTFRVGDEAVYGSYNLVYTGTIVKIGPKTVTIEDGTHRRRLKIVEFVDFNAHYDAEKIRKRNNDMMRHL